MPQFRSLNRLKTHLEAHRPFLLILALFVSFRFLTLLAFRPGGFILDFSDFYFYRSFAQLTRQGYFPYDNLWTTYPPLFPYVMIAVWHVSTLLPPWEYSNLIFNLLLGNVFLLFETGNLILIYLIATRLNPAESLKSAWFYALLFAPVYTLTGWFESYPLFFFLLSLYLLLCGRPYLSALATGIGFMVKLIPLILLPIGVKNLPLNPQRANWLRLRIPILNVDTDIPNALRYIGIFVVTVVIIGLPSYLSNPSLIFSPFSMTAFRPPWQTVWALLEGNYDYGIIPLDMRNINWESLTAPESSLPWLWITAAFGVVYTFLYTRKLNWLTPRVTVAFTGLTVCFFFLYSKGYSPQWLGWLFVFIALLLPNLRGVVYAILLDVSNLIEANVFITIFPSETWLLTATVLLRTTLIVVLAIEFSLILWPHLLTETVILWRRRLLIGGLVILLIALIPASNRLLTAYFDIRLENGPYRNSITWLREQPVKEAMLLNDHETYNWYYPYLRETHQFFMLNDYNGDGQLEARTLDLLQQIRADHAALWVYDSDPAQTSPAENVLQAWLADSQLAHQEDIDGGRLFLYIFPAESP